MCGIVGAISERNISRILLEGLKRLEYRGYDSAGIALVTKTGKLQRVRETGKVQQLANLVEQENLTGKVGMAHTRWATHGGVTECNAHPHTSHNQIAIVHNGIIENHEQIKQQLTNLGYTFDSDTDSEVIAHLVHQQRQQSDSLLEAVQKATKQLTGAYGALILDTEDPERLIIARSGSPLVIGLGIDEHFVASDQLALLPVTSRFIYLEEGDIAEITIQQVTIYNQQGEPVNREIHESELHYDAASRGEYRHYMLKEIYEQPIAIRNTLTDRLTATGLSPNSLNINLLQDINHIQILACGTSFHAGLVAKYWFEALAGVSCQVEIASEYRYRKAYVYPKSLFIAISQSGETADTLAALRLAKVQGYQSTLAVCNVAGSSLVRESDASFMTKAGTEIGVASTKAFTTQLVSLLMLVLAVAKQKNASQQSLAAISQALHSLPSKIEETLTLNQDIQALAKEFADKEHSLFLGRGEQYPIAMEGALKLKEISYIHAEAYAAGELKHGPLALIDADIPVIVVAPNNELLEKLKSNIAEVRARGGILYVFADKEAGFQSDETMHVINLPHVDDLIAPIIYTIPLQLLSYHVAIIKGTDVDQPRNLAKSVTVE